MSNIRDLNTRFVRLLADIFRAQGFEVQSEPRIGVFFPDLIIDSKVARASVEVKVLRSRVPPAAIVTQAAEVAERARAASQADTAILALNVEIGDRSRLAVATTHPKLIVYDAAVVSFLAAGRPTWRQEFEDIVRLSLPFSERVELSPREVDVRSDIGVSSTLPEVIESVPVAQLGREHCSLINAVKPGRAASKEFELKVTDALKYLFDDDLAGWSRQQSTDDQVSIYDLVARINSEHDFWDMIVRHFATRYVIFEFKNYTDQISQGQIYTTEKYLFKTALRGLAFIISPKGADAGALKAARGALREAGKLIVNLTIDDICKMLAMKDAGDDYNSVLVDRVDEMLIKLDR